ncbi:hypothetical protein WT24_11775 [Burkholderia sp. MSMB1078WGS]|uniref:hypothetical protein n=1 Tax=Burkholderia sp. MSMB1078WGS TaxID=1637900 RepID=UPI000757E7B1|nr:hypothetical protein [Burkholderia sp. MSMB1078WGS]KVT12736.1 hypothetical protein WT24_11775 [Burkholderia sp. MSMB1078WGS]
MCQPLADSIAASSTESAEAVGTISTGIVREIATSAYEIVSDHNAVFRWISQAPLAAFENKTALELAVTGNGDYVLQLL